MSKAIRLFPILPILIVTAVVLGLIFATPVEAEEPPTNPPVGEDGFIELPADFVPPPLPTIPTRAEYEAGWTTPQHTTEQASGDPQADDSGGCAEEQELVLTYWTEAIPPEQGGGTAEGYAGFYAGRTSTCYNWIQPVAGSRVTYGGEVDKCRVKGRSKRVWPSTDIIFWTKTDKNEPCGLEPARVISPPRGVVPGHRYGVWGSHRFENGNGADYWQIFGYTHLLYWVTL